MDADRKRRSTSDVTESDRRRQRRRQRPTITATEASMLQRSTTIRVGWLSREAAEALAEGCTTTRLTLWNHEPSTDMALEVLTGLRSLTWHARECSIEDVLQELRNMRLLQSLSLSGPWMRRCCNNSDESWEALKHLPDLVHLKLEYASVIQLQSLLASPESNVTDLKVENYCKSGIDSMIRAKLARLAARQEHLDRILTTLACLAQEIGLPPDLFARIVHYWSSSGGFYGYYQR